LHERIENKLFLDRTRKDSNFKRPYICATLFQIEKCCEDGFGLDMVRTEDADHGRNEVRRHFILHDVSTLNRRHAWPGLGAVDMVEVERDGKTTVTRRCFLCSRPMSAAEFAAVVRSHWQIENSLHWVLDVVFRDDHARVRKGYGARNMGLIKRIAVNLLKSATDKNSLKVRRKKASWSTGYLHSLYLGQKSGRSGGR
jgi:predicted transposase YbfD/YdcC